MTRPGSRRGGTILEFALVLPVGVALAVGCLSMGVTCLRTVQAGDLARQVSLLADSGVDFGSAGGRQQLIEKGRGLGLASGRAAVHITRIVREPGGLRVDRSYRAGDAGRWPSLASAGNEPRLEAGEQAWIVEVFAESGSILSLLPATVKARSVL